MQEVFKLQQNTDFESSLCTVLIKTWHWTSSPSLTPQGTTCSVRFKVSFFCEGRCNRMHLQARRSVRRSYILMQVRMNEAALYTCFRTYYTYRTFCIVWPYMFSPAICSRLLIFSSIVSNSDIYYHLDWVNLLANKNTELHKHSFKVVFQATWYSPKDTLQLAWFFSLPTQKYLCLLNSLHYVHQLANWRKG